MFAAGTAMPCSAKNPDLVNKIAFLHKNLFSGKSKLTVTIDYWRVIWLLKERPSLAKFFRHLLIQYKPQKILQNKFI
jgi:hypothetical protein